jgi:hypothetical protein
MLSTQRAGDVCQQLRPREVLQHDDQKEQTGVYVMSRVYVFTLVSCKMRLKCMISAMLQLSAVSCSPLLCALRLLLAADAGCCIGGSCSTRESRCTRKTEAQTSWLMFARMQRCSHGSASEIASTEYIPTTSIEPQHIYICMT